MADGEAAKQNGVTPGKLALIGVLSIVLFAVVYWNFFHKPSQSTSSARKGDLAPSDDTSGRAAEENGASDADKLTDKKLQIRTKAWPEYELAEVVAYNPFALPDAFPRPQETSIFEETPAAAVDLSAEAVAERRRVAAAKRAAAIEALRTKGVQVVFQSADDYVAIIDGREIRVGDNIEGYTVVLVGTDGITLEEGIQ